MTNHINYKPRRNDLLSTAGLAILQDRYMLPGEDPQEMFMRVATTYADDQPHAQRLYDYMSSLWFMPSTPVLTNGGAERGLPISCFLNEAEDSLRGIIDLWTENCWLAAKGGGIGSYWGNLRSLGEQVHRSGQTGGVIPFIKVQDALTLAISQGSIRKGSAAVYLPIWHPEIEEFLHIRKPTGDDSRKSLNIHHGILIDDTFMWAVENGQPYHLVSPKTNEIVSTVDARELWAKILVARVETGEPYLVYIDTVNRKKPETYKKLGMDVKMSNLCSEIVLATGKDYLGNERTAVCCLSSLNLDKWDEWKDNPMFIEDIMRFLDNVLQDFIERAPPEMEKARYAAMMERSVGLGVMGFHSLLQKKGLPFESAMSKSLNKRVFAHIRAAANLASEKLAGERGACPDAKAAGLMERFVHKMAIAPTASISNVCGSVSPGIEPYVANSFTQKTMSGSFTIRNPYLDEIIRNRLRLLYDVKDAETKYDEVWASISSNEGSVQHLNILDEQEKEVFKTAQELDQRWIIEMAADRADYVDQAQSVNVFLPPTVHKKYLSDLHYMAWRLGLKSLYYCRSVSIGRSDKVSHEAVKYEECQACQ